MTEQAQQALSIPVEILGLSDVAVTNVKTDLRAHEITIQVTSTKEIVPCRQCAKPTSSHGFGRTLHLRHLPILGKKTIIEITPRRGLCKDCDGGLTTTEKLDWYDLNSKQTKPYEQHLLFELVNSTVADVSRKEDIDSHTVENLIDKYIEAEINFDSIKSLGVLGLDEISLKKGHRDFVTLITYRSKAGVRILSIIKGREKAKISAFLRSISRRLQKTIKVACCDLYEGYINACKEVFGDTVPVVADRFHVRKLYRKSLVQLRKSELKRLKRTLSSDEYHQLKEAIALLRRHRDYFTADEKIIVSPLFKLSPKLEKAYHSSRKLSGIFDSLISPETAREKIAEWIVLVADSELTCFDDFIKTLNKHIIEISNYFIDRNNSGFVEGFNNKVKALKRRCYGLSDAKRLFQRLLLDTTGFVRFAPNVAAY